MSWELPDKFGLCRTLKAKINSDTYASCAQAHNQPMTEITESKWRIVSNAWEALANALRIYSEERRRMPSLIKVDREEAVVNVDRAFEQILEKFHAVYDLTKSIQPFKYFERADTSLVIVLRNAIHHRDHELFVSWNSAIMLNGGPEAKAGAAYLLGSHTPWEEASMARFLYPLHDFYELLQMPKARIKDVERLRAMWDRELELAKLALQGRDERYPDKQVYLDVMGILVSAVSAVSRWLSEVGVTPAGFDGQVYLKHFGGLPTLSSEIKMKQLRIIG